MNIDAPSDYERESSVPRQRNRDWRGHNSWFNFTSSERSQRRQTGSLIGWSIPPTSPQLHYFSKPVGGTNPYPQGCRCGAVREVIAAGAWLREGITAYDPPRAYSYRVIKSFPAANHDGGTVSLTPADLCTRVVWVSTYTIPARGGGKLIEAVTSPFFRSCFDAILAGCAKGLES